MPQADCDEAEDDLLKEELDELVVLLPLSTLSGTGVRFGVSKRTPVSEDNKKASYEGAKRCSL